jgi:PAS domain S-box-containing protein
MAGIRNFFYAAGLVLALSFAVFAALQWNELSGLKKAFSQAAMEKDLRAAALAGEALGRDPVTMLAPYPLYDFASRYGFSQIIVMDEKGGVLNDTLAQGRPATPAWLSEERRLKALSGLQDYFTTGKGDSMRAVVLAAVTDLKNLPETSAETKGPFLVAFISRGVPPGEGDVFTGPGFIFLAVVVIITVLMAYSFIKFYSKEGKNSSGGTTQVGFVVDTFQDLVGKLKENERELETLRRRAEARADRIEDLSENILRSVPGGVITFSEDLLKIMTVNPGAEKILGFRREDVVGKKTCAEIPGGELARCVQEAGTVSRAETRHRTASGKELWLGYSITPLLSKDGTKLGRILVFTDLTELKTLERQAELRARLSSLGEMAAGVAHELRNPMAVIAGYSKMLSKNVPAGLRGPVDSISKEIAAMDSIINGFLSFARPRQPVPERVDLKAVLLASVQAALAAGKDEKTETILEIPEITLPAADAVMLKQAFGNLVRNALEAMPEGGRLMVRAHEADDAVRVVVSDSGHGIPESRIERIFLPFYTSKEGGTGLGLAITHAIIERHGGQISVESSEEGTSFTVRLPK